MKGYTIEPSNKPSFRICERLTDNHRILLDGEYISWATFKSQNSNWDFEVENETDTFKSVGKCAGIWLRIGEKLCKNLKIEYNPDCFSSETPTNLTACPLHIVLILDSSGSMRGDRWKCLIKTVEQFLDDRSKSKCDIVTVICFGTEATVEIAASSINGELTQGLIDFENVNKKTGSATNYAKAVTCLNGVLEQQIGEEKSDDRKFAIVFMSDGEASLPANEIEILKGHKAKILKFWTVGFNNKNNYDNVIKSAIMSMKKGERFEVLKNIANEMEGEFKMPSDPIELQIAYSEIANSLEFLD